jgi:hypothetical protein
VALSLRGDVPLHQVYLMPDAERKAYEEAMDVAKRLDRESRALFVEAREAGRDAAPYYHAKLASLDVKQKTKMTVGLKEYSFPPKEAK